MHVLFLIVRFMFDFIEDKTLSANLQVQHDCSDILLPFFSSDGLIVGALDYAMKQVRFQTYLIFALAVVLK